MQERVCENMLLKNYCAAINRLTTAPCPALVFQQFTDTWRQCMCIVKNSAPLTQR